MRIIRLIVTILIGYLCLAGTLPLGPGSIFPVGPSNIGFSPPYVGPGDVVSGASFWYGLRGYNRATLGAALVNVCLPADSACADFSSNAATGVLVVTSISGTSCANVTCTIKTWYDQGSAHKNLTQATIASRPTLGIGATACVRVAVCAVFPHVPGNVSSGAPSIAQPFSMSLVAVEVAGAGFTSFFGADDGVSTFNYILLRNTDGTAELSANSSLENTACCIDGNWHALLGVANSTASTLTGEGITVAGNVGTAPIAVTDNIHMGSDGYAEPCTCHIVEAGVWPVGFTSGPRSVCRRSRCIR